VSAAPQAASVPAADLEYVGFWLRVGATLIDTLWITPVIAVLALIYQHADTSLTDVLLRDPASVSVSALAAALTPSPADFAVNYLLPAVLIVFFWRRASATPGKMLIHARIVDADSGAAPSFRQLLIRYLGYFVSTIPLALGLLWVGIDARKQGWHDKLAGTVVVRPKVRPVAAVKFPGQESR
jgi:uncharacterized RDD family membrane protein YckC